MSNGNFMRITDNYDEYERYERQRERDEKINETFAEISELVDDIETQCMDYDTEDNKDLCNRLQNISELVDKLKLIL